MAIFMYQSSVLRFSHNNETLTQFFFNNLRDALYIYIHGEEARFPIKLDLIIFTLTMRWNITIVRLILVITITLPLLERKLRYVIVLCLVTDHFRTM